MPLIHDHAHQPHGGHFFNDPSGYLIRAKSIKELLASIRLYRANNGFPSGNPEQEIEAFYVTQFPWLVTKVGVVPEAQEDPLERWLNRIWRESARKFCETVTTEERLAVCEKCEHYYEREYDAQAMRKMTVITGGRLKEAGSCHAHHWACGVAATLEKPEPRFTVDGCWAT